MSNIVRQRGEMFAEDRRDMTPARRKFIQDHRKYADTHNSELPYQIGIFKPKIGKKIKDIEIKCRGCGRIMFVAETTYAVECSSCKTLWIK